MWRGHHADARDYGAIVSRCQVATAADAFTVHEWGTFTSRHGADGVAQRWNPLSETTDLPRFVYQNQRIPKQFIEGNVRMETPVLYFYADARTTVSVDVDFPSGTMSEWYPRVKRTRDGLRWPKVTILPGAALRVTVQAVYDFARALREEGPLAEQRFIESFKQHPLGDLHTFAGFDQVRAWEEEFLPADELDKYADSVGHRPAPKR